MLGLRLDPDMERAIDRIARREHRSKSEVVREALRTYLDGLANDEALINQVRSISALTTSDDAARIDELQDDLEALLRDEESRIAARRAA